LSGDVGTTFGFGIVGRRNERMFPRNVNELSGVEVDVACVGVVGVVAGVVGMVVGVVGMVVGIVGIEVMTGGGFIGADMVAIDRRARPSSGSTEIDALLLVRRPAARRWLCSWCGFIGFFS